MSKQKQVEGVGIVAFILILLVVATSCSVFFQRYGAQVRSMAGGLAQELAGGALGVEPCMPGADDVYDPRAQRYRNQRTGRFTRPPGC